ncbi:extracellular solute-binding protein [Streptomyces sp. NPDC020965]|uniref:extracellular solute-binding protein n=1 Tax=Streptomyces sp. NPDC020965 TaxID=3365105 RepID=UPI0037B1A6B6
MNIRPLPPFVALVCAFALTGCGLMPGSGSDTTTLRIWLMKDSVSDDFLKRFTQQYEKDHPSVKLEVTFQEWTGIGKKVNAALEGTEETPDIIEVGNTQVAQYAESDALMDLTLESVRDLGSEDWLEGLAQPGNINGSQYGIPWYAANRVVIYNKDLFEAAGVKPPKSREEWLETTEKLNDGGNQGIYLAGQDWYTLAGFIWEEGGELAVERGGAWEGTLHTKAALRGLDFYKEIQALGKGPKNGDERTPPQANVFAKGNVAQLIDKPGAAGVIEEANPKLKGKLGYFPIPGKSENKPGAVFTGGSDLIIPTKAAQRGAAVEVVKALASERWQTDLARTMDYVPNKKTLTSVIQGREGTSAMAKGAAAKGSRATPNSPKWANVEVDNPIKPFMTIVLQGGEAARAARQASESITSILAPG